MGFTTLEKLLFLGLCQITGGLWSVPFAMFCNKFSALFPLVYHTASYSRSLGNNFAAMPWVILCFLFYYASQLNAKPRKFPHKRGKQISHSRKIIQKQVRPICLNIS